VGTAEISVVVLQNGMDLLKGELGSSIETCIISALIGKEVTDIEAEKISYIMDEEHQEQMTLLEIKTEPKVSCVPVVSVTHFSYRLYSELPAGLLVCPCKRSLILENGFCAVFKKGNLYFVPHCM